MLRAERVSATIADYLGSLEVRELMKVPADSLPFDDLLLVSEDGSVVYQDKKAGPQFTTLSSLLKAQITRQTCRGGAGQAGGRGVQRKAKAAPGTVRGRPARFI